MFEKHATVVGEMNKAGVRLLAGTEEGNPYCFAGFCLHGELGWLVKVGLTPAETLRAATSSPAEFFGQEGTLGTVAEGRLADLVVLDGDPVSDIANTMKIYAVLSRGKLFDRAALDGLLQEAKHEAAHPKWGGRGG